MEVVLGSCSAEVLGECLRKELTGWCSESKEEVTEGFSGADDTLCV